jgi:hypothetical protein
LSPLTGSSCGLIIRANVAPPTERANAMTRSRTLQMASRRSASSCAVVVTARPPAQPLGDLYHLRIDLGMNQWADSG